MFSKLPVLLAATSGLSAIAAPSAFISMDASQHLTNSISEEDACGKISSIYSRAQENDELENLKFPGDLAFKCLQSFPFHRNESVQFVDELSKYLQFQTTTETLMKPPKGYLSPAVDLFGGMKSIRERAVESGFDSQYEFDNAINTLWSTANDGHLGVLLCSQNVFEFQSSLMLVSISKDGLELPQIYTYQDAMTLQQSPDSVSPVVRINGEDVETYVENRSRLQLFQDPDARYNRMFPSFARTVYQKPDLPYDSFSSANGVWPGQYATQRVEYGNGTSEEIPFVATYSQDKPFAFESGKNAWEWFCTPEEPATAEEPSEETSSAEASTNPSKSKGLDLPKRYPKPVVRDDYNLLSGYFLDEESFSDVAVLFVPTFNPAVTQDANELVAFPKHLTRFLEEAVKADKKRLIIDLSGNSGGTIGLGYDMFQALFPNEEIYAAARFRDHEALRLAFKALRNVTIEDPAFQYTRSTFTSENMVKVDQQTGFDSWEEIFENGEREWGTPVTAMMANMNLDVESVWGMPIRGHGPVKNNETTSPFAAEDILVVTDGSCTSTCTIFLELLKGVGVKTVTFGGRPQKGPMQAIGGSEGCQVANLETLTPFAKGLLMAIEESAKAGNPVLSKEETEKLMQIFPLPASELPMYVKDISVNLKNAYRKGNDHMPLQFQYDAADCRLFYTYENVYRPGSTWVSAAKALWGGRGCVEGSTPDKQ